MRKLNNAKKKREREKRRRLLNISRKGGEDKIECIYIKRLNVIHGHSSRRKSTRFVLELGTRRVTFRPVLHPAFINTRLTTIVIASRIPPGRFERMRSGREWERRFGKRAR